MIRSEFMKKLEQFLAELSPQERQEAIDYYNSYMDDAGIGINDTVPESIGTPEEVAKELKRSILNPDTDFIADEKININVPDKKNMYSNFNNKKKSMSGNEIALIVIIAILTSPIWITIVMAAFSVVVGVVAVAFGLGVAFISLIIAGVALVIAGFAVLLTETATAVGLMGAGFIVMSIGIVLSICVVNCIAVFIPWVIKSISKLAKKIMKKEAV